MRLPSFLLAVVTASLATAAPRVEYRDNARPIRLQLPGNIAAASQAEVFLRGTERIRAEVLPGPRNPTWWANAEGRALPGLQRMGEGFGRFGTPRSAALAYYWSDETHHGKVTWRRGHADPQRLRALADELSAAWTGEREGGWLAVAARLPEGSQVRFEFPDVNATLQVFGGPAEAARREADARLHRVLAAGTGWEPVLGMHSPSWQAARESVVGAVLIAGPVLLFTGNPGGPELLKHLGQMIERPLPRAPEVGEDPMGPAPPEAGQPETAREKRWKDRSSP